MATIKDVARLAGVSQSTVSKYINGGQVRPANVEAIRSAIAALEYRVNPFARSLKTQRSHSVGILLPTLAVPFYSYIFTALDKVLRENGYHTIISCYSSDHGLERDYLNFLISTGADGLIYLPENLTADEFSEITANRGVPVIQVDRVIPGITADAVLTDNTESSCQAVCRLIRGGHRRIAAISGPSFIQTARERGIRIPDSITVFGYDCVDVCSMMTPPLPVVCQPEQEIGRTAAQWLIRRLEGDDSPPRTVRLKCSLQF